MRHAALLLAFALVAGLTAASASATTFDGQFSLSGSPVVSYGDDPTILSPDGHTVAWKNVVEGDPSGQIRIAVADVTGQAATPRILTDVVDSHTADVLNIRFTPDSTRLVFQADLDTDDDRELYVVPVDGSAAPVRIAEVVPAGDIRSFRITADGATAVFLGDAAVDETDELFSVPIDGSSDPVRLSAAPVAGGNVASYSLTADGSRVLFRADLVVDDRQDLWSAPVDGSAPAVMISDSSTGTGITQFSLAEDNADIVAYVGELTTAGEVTAYVRDVLGSDPQQQVSVHDVAGGDVFGAGLSPDGTYVVYNGKIAGPEADVFARRADLSNDQQRLNQRDAEATGDIFNVVVTPDSQRVLFRSDLFTAGEVELFSTPLDASSPMVTLSPPPTGAQTISNYRSSPDSMWAVFALEGGGQADVWASPIDGSSPPVEVSDNDHPTGFAYVDEVTRDNRVIFGSDQDTPGAYDLWVRPIDLSIPAIRVNNAFEDGGFADDSQLSPNEDFILFNSDIDGSGNLTVLGSSRGLPPQPATNVAISGITHHEAEVTWTASEGAAVERYIVTATIADGGRAASSSRVEVAAGQESFMFSGLSGGTTYNVVVKAESAAGTAATDAVTFTTSSVKVVRIAGQDRYETAALVALDRFDPDDVDVVYLAVGTDFPDALAGGPLAAAMDAPILLTRTDELPKVTADALATLDPDKVVALGGPVAISDSTVTAAGVAAGATTSRLAGSNRFATAAAIAAELPVGFDTVYIATGRNYPDALAGGPATGGAPILLVEPTALPPATAAALAAIKPGKVVALGGNVAVTNSVLAAAGTSAGGAATSRIAGQNRYATAAGIAGLVGETDTVYVAVGTNYPDALAAGPAAEAEGAPIVLTNTSELPAETLALLTSLNHVHRIVVLGGEVAVSKTVAAKLATLLK